MSEIPMPDPVHYHLGKFPPDNLDWSRLIPLLGPAGAALARYDGLLQAIPNASVLLSPMTTQEAVLSSRIEGTYATMGEVLEFEAAGPEDFLDPDKSEDIREVLNYRRAMQQATEDLQSLPLCNRLIRNAHAALLSGVRGSDKGPGEFRGFQNYIGAPGSRLAEVRFVPIAPGRVLDDGMARWEKYLHEETPDVLVQLAIAHAEFESLHPFLDGNGRIGRMIIPLFLFVRGQLHAPMFYLSDYLESNRQEYCDRLLAVSRDDDWTGWCLFFLHAIIRQATQNEIKTRRILDLYQKRKSWILATTHSHRAIPALDFLFNTPIFNSTTFTARMEIPAQTARRILNLLSNEGILKVLKPSRGQQPPIYAFSELLNIAEGRNVF
jgi:Fic family protein